MRSAWTCTGSIQPVTLLSSARAVWASPAATAANPATLLPELTSKQDHFGRAEGYNIVHADEQFFVPTDGKPLRGLIQVSACHAVWCNVTAAASYAPNHTEARLGLSAPGPPSQATASPCPCCPCRTTLWAVPS